MFTNIFEYIAVSRRLEFQWLWYSAPSSCGPRRIASPVKKSGRPGWCTATDLCALQVALYIKNWRPAQRREHAAPVLIRAGLVGAVSLQGSEAPTAWPRPAPVHVRRRRCEPAASSLGPARALVPSCPRWWWFLPATPFLLGSPGISLCSSKLSLHPAHLCLSWFLDFLLPPHHPFALRVCVSATELIHSFVLCRWIAD